MIANQSNAAAAFVHMANRFAKASAFIFNFPEFERRRLAQKLDAHTTMLGEKLGDNPTPQMFEQIEAEADVYENRIREVAKMHHIFLSLAETAISIYRMHPSEELLGAIELNVMMLQEDY